MGYFLRWSLPFCFLLLILGLNHASAEEEESFPIIDSISPSPAAYGAIVTFVGNYSGDEPISYNWTSSIDEFLYGSNESSSFNSSTLSIGVHTITFQANYNGSDGDWNATTSQLLQIYAYPLCFIDSVPESMERDATATLEGHGDDPDGEIVGFWWNSSIDGYLGDNSILDITGLSLGNHNITLHVIDDSGLITHTSAVSLRVYANPLAIPGDNLEDIETGSIIQFSGAGIDDDGEIVLYEWDFDGDGIFEWNSEENGITTFIYNKAGTYSATLRVTDSDGNTATGSRNIQISQGLTSSIPGIIIDAEAGLLIVATVGLLIAIFSRRV